MHKPNMVFFGTPPFAVSILEALKKEDLLPKLIVTAPDTPQGRGLVLTPPAVKVWADAHNIPTIQPASLTQTIPEELTTSSWDFFIVAAYGKILPQTLLDLPTHGTLNVHPSLLPQYRGASPIEGQILNDAPEIGVTIMLMDAKLDHGPILLQEILTPPSWPLTKDRLTDLFAHTGGVLLVETIHGILDETITPQPQDHAQATFTGKIEKKDGEITLADNPYQNYLKYCAYHPWPGTFFFAQKNGKEVRIKIADAEYIDNSFLPRFVIPEGKQKISWEDFQKAGYELGIKSS